MFRLCYGLWRGWKWREDPVAQWVENRWFIKGNPIIKVRQAGVEAQVSDNARYINSRLESSRRDHRKQGQYQEVRNNMNKQQRDTRLNTNGGGVTGLTTIHMNKNNTEQDLQIKPETGSWIRNSTRKHRNYTQREMTNSRRYRKCEDLNIGIKHSM